MKILRAFVKSLPTLLLSFFLGLAVWISAINASDPVRQAVYSRPVPIERIGLDPSMVIVSEPPNQESITLSAPGSSWERISNDKAPVRAWIDLSGLGAGVHNVPVNIQVTVQPTKLVSNTPRTVSVALEKLVTQEFPIHLIRRGDPAIGFQADLPSISQEKVTISGPASLVAKVKDARVTLDLTQANDNINRKLDVQVVDGSDAPVENLSITPAQVVVTQPISQLGGYRNVVIKVASTGQVAGGYRLTSMSVYPPTVTVFSSNPQLVDRLPGYVETSPLDLTGVKEDVDRRLPLNLPNGVEVVGDQTVLVQVGVAAIEGSITLSALPIQVVGLPEDLAARISPESVDVIISGPVPLLDRLTETDVRVYLDLSGVAAGTYQYAPKITLAIAELKLESILPSSIEVVVESKLKVTPSRTPPAGVGLAPTPTSTPTR